MALDSYERGNCVKADVEFKMNSVYTDPSGNKAFVNVIKPDGTYLVGNGSGATASRTGVGTYSYYFDTSSTDPLGIYVVQWSAYHSLGTIDGITYGYKPIIQRDSILIVDTDPE